MSKIGPRRFDDYAYVDRPDRPSGRRDLYPAILGAQVLRNQLGTRGGALGAVAVGRSHGSLSLPYMPGVPRLSEAGEAGPIQLAGGDAPVETPSSLRL